MDCLSFWGGGGGGGGIVREISKLYQYTRILYMQYNTPNPFFILYKIKNWKNTTKRADCVFLPTYSYYLVGEKCILR